MATPNPFLNSIIKQTGARGMVPPPAVGTAPTRQAAPAPRRTPIQVTIPRQAPPQPPTAPAANPMNLPDPSAQPVPTLDLANPVTDALAPFISMETGLSDTFYRQFGRFPTPMELASVRFATDFQQRMGRPPTRMELIAHLSSRNESVPETQDFRT